MLRAASTNSRSGAGSRRRARPGRSRGSRRPRRRHRVRQRRAGDRHDGDRQQHDREALRRSRSRARRRRRQRRRARRRGCRAVVPTTPPMTITMTTASAATRAAISRRLRMSRPNWSVPSRCARRALQRRIEVGAFGGVRRDDGPKTAASRKIATRTQASGVPGDEVGGERGTAAPRRRLRRATPGPSRRSGRDRRRRRRARAHPARTRGSISPYERSTSRLTST